MSFEFLIVSRFIKARKSKNFVSFITYISITGVMLGSAALIIALSILGGFEKTITEKLIGFASHIRVQGYEGQLFDSYQSDLEKIRKEIPEVSAVTPFVGKEALIRSKSKIDGVFVNGVDVETDFSETKNQIVAGKYSLLGNGTGTVNEIVIGKKLANKLNVGIGDKIIIQGISGLPSPFNMPRVYQFTISGLFETGMSEYDDINVYISLKASQALFGFGNSVSGYSIGIQDPQKAQDLSGRIMRVMGYPYYARTIFQIYRNFFNWIELQKKPIPLILGLIIAVATFNIIGTLLMVVMEKTNEIGVLRAMGANSRSIRKIFVMEGLFIGIIGTILGNIVAFSLCYMQQEFKVLSLPSGIYYMDSVPIFMRWEQFALVSGISLALCFLSTLIPAFVASKLNPINSIRFS
jgi:lipoprotein-releasing system permease protein